MCGEVEQGYLRLCNLQLPYQLNMIIECLGGVHEGTLGFELHEFVEAELVEELIIAEEDGFGGFLREIWEAKDKSIFEGNTKVLELCERLREFSRDVFNFQTSNGSVDIIIISVF